MTIRTALPPVLSNIVPQQEATGLLRDTVLYSSLCRAAQWTASTRLLKALADYNIPLGLSASETPRAKLCPRGSRHSTLTVDLPFVLGVEDLGVGHSGMVIDH